MSQPAGDNLREAFRALAGRDLSGLERIWRSLAVPLHHYACTLTGSEEDADDILGDVMVRLAQRGWRLRLVRNPKAYLFAAVRNAAVSLARRPRVAGPEDIDAHDEGPDARTAAVRAAVVALPDDQREAVVLHIWGGLTFREISDVQRVSENTAASRYRYAIEKLRRELGDETHAAGRVREESG